MSYKKEKMLQKLDDDRLLLLEILLKGPMTEPQAVEALANAENKFDHHSTRGIMIVMAVDLQVRELVDMEVDDEGRRTWKTTGSGALLLDQYKEGLWPSPIKKKSIILTTNQTTLLQVLNEGFRDSGDIHHEMTERLGWKSGETFLSTMREMSQLIRTGCIKIIKSVPINRYEITEKGKRALRRNVN